jgi:hypothetical protein
LIKTLVTFSILCVLLISSCGKKEEQQVFAPPGQETKKDPEQERLEREEFERLKRLESGDSASFKDTVSSGTDTTSASSTDTSSSVTEKKQDKKKLVQKEKELNQRLDNPKIAINDYIELLQRGTSDNGSFEQNMKKASDQWEKSNIERFKRNYKDTKKIIVVEEPKVISQKDGDAVVDVRIKKIDNKDGKEVETNMTVRYVLAADSKGKWKIRANKVTSK